jgi:hypothetical protein
VSIGLSVWLFWSPFSAAHDSSILALEGHEGFPSGTVVQRLPALFNSYANVPWRRITVLDLHAYSDGRPLIRSGTTHTATNRVVLAPAFRK